MRIRKRRPTATSADGGPPLPPPPPPQQRCHDIHSGEDTAFGRCQWNVQAAESLRSEELVASAAAAEAVAKMKKPPPNCTTGTGGATMSSATTSAALHDSRANYNNMSLLFMGDQQQREAFTSMQDSRRTTVATSELVAGGPRVVLDHAEKARIRRQLEEEMKFSTDRLSSWSEPDNPGFRTSAGAAAVLPDQTKQENEDVNVESEFGATQRRITSNWAMPSLQGLRRPRSRSNSNSMQKLQNDALAAGRNSRAHKFLQDNAQLTSISSRSSDDSSMMQGVQQACPPPISWPEVSVRIAGLKRKLVGELVMRSKSLSMVNNKVDDQKRETSLRSSICSSGGSKQTLKKSGKGKRSFHGAHVKKNDYIGSDGIKHPLQFTAQNGFDQISQHEDMIMGSSCCNYKSTNKSGTASAARENGVGDWKVLEDQLLRPSNIVNKKRARADYKTIAAAGEGSDKLGKESNSKCHDYIGKQTDPDFEEAGRRSLGGGGGSAGIIITGAAAAAAGTSSRWRKKCRPVFRSINDIQRRAPLIRNDNNNHHHHHCDAPASNSIADHVDGSASMSDHDQGDDTTQARDHHASPATPSYSSAADASSDHRHASPSSSTSTTSDVDSQDLVNVHQRVGCKRPDDQRVAPQKKKKKKQLNKMNNLMMTMIADAAEEEPLVISRPSIIKSCKVAHAHKLLCHHNHHHQLLDLQPYAPGRPQNAAASHGWLPGVELNIEKSSTANHHQVGDYYVMSQPINCRCSLNSDPFDWRPDFSHFI